MRNNGPGDLLSQIDRHFDGSSQAWLLGAGISVGAGLPLMGALTVRVRELAQGRTHQALLEDLIAELPANSHIEHVLSQLGDYSAIASRVAANSVTIGGQAYGLDKLREAHTTITRHVAETIRWGYIAQIKDVPAVIGTRDNPLAKIDDHAAFVHVLFDKRQAGLSDRKKPVHFFTTNYDTLLEDALSLGKYPYWDGFSGGAVAFRNHQYGKAPKPDGMRAMVVKLHGSIDWVLGSEGDVWRVRDTDTYPKHHGRVLIHPQSTKYVSTQKDPFAAQFDIFRRVLGGTDEIVLGVAGYSFGDEHVNEEIERALSANGSKVTLIAFCRENNGLPECLGKWLSAPWGDQVFVLTEKSVYWGKAEPAYSRAEGEHAWWTFNGLIEFLRNGGHAGE